MEAQDSKLMNEFRTRAQPLIRQLNTLLEAVEPQMSEAARLRDYGRIVDLILQSSRTLGQSIDSLQHPIHRISDYALVCRSVALHTSEIVENQALYDTAVALLMDATEVLADMISLTSAQAAGEDPVKKYLNQKLVERLQWMSYQFRDLESKVRPKIEEEENKMSQNDIDDLLKKLGVA